MVSMKQSAQAGSCTGQASFKAKMTSASSAEMLPSS
jgi:hypothetical protein